MLLQVLSLVEVHLLMGASHSYPRHDQPVRMGASRIASQDGRSC